MVTRLLGEFEHNIGSLTLRPGRGGVFEVTIDGDLVYSKLETDRHAEYDDVAIPLRERLAAG